MRRIFFILLMLIPVMIFAQNYVQIGDGATDGNIPIYTSWNYSWFSGLYNSSDLGEAKTITSLAFHGSVDFATTMENQQVFLKHTTDAEFPSGTASYIFPYENPTANGYTMVYDGNVEYNLGWVIIDIEDFEYNGTDNLVLHWENSHGSEMYSVKFSTTATDANIVKAWGADEAVPTADGYAPYPKAYPNMRVYFESDGPATPENPVPANSEVLVSTHTDLSFELDSAVTTYDVLFGSDASNLTTIVTDATASTNNSVDIDDLDFNTNYNWQVIAKAGGSETASPVWNFTTEMIISDFPYNEGFEGDFPPAGWQTNSASWIRTGGDWDPSTPHSGSYCAEASTFHYGEEAILTSSKFVIGVNQRISFWWADADYMSRIDGVDETLFEITSDDGSTWTTLATLSAPEAMTAYEESFFGLSDYAGMEVSFRWRDVVPAEYSYETRGILLDDIVIENNPEEAVFSINYDSFTFNPLVPGGTTYFDLTLTNTGADANIEAITLDAPFSCDFTGTIAAQQDQALRIVFAAETVGNHSVTGNIVATGTATGETSFTIAGEVIAPITELFESFENAEVFPSGWNAYVNSEESAANVWVHDSEYDAHTGTKFIKMYNAADTLEANIMAVMPGIANITDNTLSFYTKSSWGEAGNNLKVGLVKDPYRCADFELIQTIELTGEYTEITINFEASDKKYIAFRHGAGGNIGYGVYVDDVSWQTAGGEPMPATIVYPEFDAPEVQISYLENTMTEMFTWAEGLGNPDGYFFSLGTDADASNIVYFEDTTELNYSITSALEYNTTYYWQIVPYNGSGNAVSCPIWEFTTMADPTVTINSTTTYTEGFETAEIGFLPVGMEQENVNDDTAFWSAIANSESYQNAHSGNQAGHIMFSFLEAHNDWMYTAPLALEANQTYQLSFYYKATALMGSIEKMDVYLGTEPNSETMTNQLFVNDNIDSNEYALVNVDFTTDDAGNYFVGFHAFSDAAQFVLLVDDIEVSLVATGAQEDVVYANSQIIGNYPNPFNPVTEIKYNLAKEQLVLLEIYNAKGQKVNTLVNQRMEAGVHNVSWNGTSSKGDNMPSGIYLYKLNVTGKNLGKMVLLK